MSDTPRLFAIGDIHGHYAELIALMTTLYNEAGLDSHRDTVVFLGDYVDGGPQTREVLTYLIDMQRLAPHWIFLRGNHEQMWLDAFKEDHGSPDEGYLNWYLQGGKETLESYTAKPLKVVPEWKEHRCWVASLPLWYETDRYIFVHAGLRPLYPPEKCAQEDLLWIRDLFIKSDYDWGKRVVYGHTPVTEPLVLKNKIGIDTMPRNSGKLTAVELTDTQHPMFFFEESHWDRSFREEAALT